jgi:hypothetical protein
MVYLINPVEAGNPVRLIIRAAPCQLRIIEVWQALAQHVARVRRSRARETQPSLMAFDAFTYRLPVSSSPG